VAPSPASPETSAADGPGRTGDEENSALGQALYRRFRPQRFAELVGQDHVRQALQNAVRRGQVGHAYLFSGPRGTGKTSTARILAKALNCQDPADGEPCGRCQSCREIAAGTSLDVFELDAASHNGVEAMRELVARAALGTPGRTKVYIVDEVHMLSTAAANALLKTLEEPPAHVVFVLATTDPQKVPATVRSRTQHFAFRLLPPELLTRLLQEVRERAGLPVSDELLEAAVRRGHGSARDSLSALDQLAAGGEAAEEGSALVGAVLGALAACDGPGGLRALGQALALGLDPERLAGELVERGRQVFLATVAPELLEVTGAEREAVLGWASALGPARAVQLLEGLGRALVAMRDAPDPRAHLEVTLLRLAAGPGPVETAQGLGAPAGETLGALAARLERLEAAVARLEAALAGGTGPAVAEAPPSPTVTRPLATGSPPTSEARAEPEAGGPPRGPALARRTLGAVRRQQAAAVAPTQIPEGPTSGAPPGSPGGGSPGGESPDGGGPGVGPAGMAASTAAGASSLPSREELTRAWGDGLLQSLPPRPRARFRVGRFLAVEGDTAVFALPNATHLGYCEEVRREVEAHLAAHFGRPVPLRLVVDDDPVPGTGGEPRSPGSGPGAPERAVSGPGAGGASGGPAEPAKAIGADEHEDEEALLDRAALEDQTRPAGPPQDAVGILKATFPGSEEETRC
jgi:DNA polymerase-3 subunit gamma/tau